MTGLLEGVRVVSFAQWLLGPAATQYLADMGADVVKVERPGSGAFERSWSGGDTYQNDVSVFFLLANRNARSLTIDLASADGQKVARRLVAGADVVISNFRPGIMERFGLDYDSVRKVNEDVIYAIGTGYGRDNPHGDLPGQDLLIQALTGLAHITGRRGEAPRPAGSAVVDQHGASLLAMGILGALVRRARSGEGEFVEVTMTEAAFDLQLEPLVYHLNGGFVEKPRRPVGSAFHQAPYGIYETSDGWMALSMSPLSDVVEALGGVDLGQKPEDFDLLRDRDRIHESLQAEIQKYPTIELVDRLQTNGIWCAPVHDYDAALADPVVRHLDSVFTMNDPQAGDVKMLRHPIRYDSWPASVKRPPPAVGEHTEELLAELGYSDGEIRTLKDDGTV